MYGCPERTANVRMLVFHVHKAPDFHHLFTPVGPIYSKDDPAVVPPILVSDLEENKLKGQENVKRYV